MEPQPVPKPRPRRVNWRARAQRNEEAAALLFAILNAGNLDVSDGVLVAPVTSDVLDRLACFELDGDADLEHVDEREGAPIGGWLDEDAEEDDAPEDGDPTEPNGDEREDVDGDEYSANIEAGLAPQPTVDTVHYTPVAMPDYNRAMLPGYVPARTRP